VSRTALLALAAVLVAGLLPGAAAAQAPPPAIPLGEGWEYRADHANAGLRAGWRTGAGTDGWVPATVPPVFDGRPLDHAFGGSIGWYRIALDPPAARGFDWAVAFGQARRRARVWLNGVEVGRSDDAYAPFEVPLTGLRRGGPNVLVVRVDNRKSRLEREGWWNWGGLTRPVELRPVGPAALRSLRLLPRLRCSGESCRARVLVRGELEGRARRALAPSVRVVLRAPSGSLTRVRLPAPGRLANGDVAELREEVEVKGTPELWSPESPALYDATVEVVAAGRVAQVDRLRIGLRQVRVRDGRLELNGRPLQLRGASIQEDVPGRGPALTDADVERVAADLVAVGADVTRAHYPLDERLLRRFDELGILVWSQAPVYHADALLRRGRTPRALASVRATVLAGASHPSVLVHSVANELAAKADRHPATRDFLEQAAALVRELDPTRPVALDVLSYPRIARQRVYELYDALGINNYFGWYASSGPHSTGDFDQLEPYLHAIHRRYPRHALVMTEFGAEALEEGPADLKGTYAFQSDYLARTLDVVDRATFLSGAIYWTLHEFAVKPAWDGGIGRSSVAVDPIHNKGLIAYDGTRKPAWDLARERFAAVPSYR
jgi:beta-galactosidase/beta-glucuronidase